MSETERVSNLILGGDESGKYLAWELAQQGHPVVVIERALIGAATPGCAGEAASDERINPEVCNDRRGVA